VSIFPCPSIVKIQTPGKKMHWLFTVCLLIFSNPSFAIELVNDEMVSGAISVLGEQDTYTFSANAGDTVRCAASANVTPNSPIY
jgi:hypothetical protein